MPEIGYHHLSPAERWIIVRSVEEQSQSLSAVAEALNCSTRTVKRVLALYRRTRDVIEQHGGGRQHVYSQRQMQRLHTLAIHNPHATSTALRGLMGPSAPPISDRTLRRYLREINIVQRKEGVEVVDTPRLHALRLAWAQQHRDDPIQDWLFMDESTLMLRHTGDLVWAERGKPVPSHPIEQLFGKVHVWGIVWNDGSVFGQYHGQPTSRKVFNLLMEHLTPLAPDLAGRTLVADGASYHWTKEVRSLYDDIMIAPLQLPPKSPRFTAIKRCWGWIKRRVKRLAPINAEELKQHMATACAALPASTIRGYIRETKSCIRNYK
jgi:transposase